MHAWGRLYATKPHHGLHVPCTHSVRVASALVCGAPGGRPGAGGGVFVDRLPTGGHFVTTGGRSHVPMRRCMRGA
eukprot:5222974-Prymnesium_polylepis.1